MDASLGLENISRIPSPLQDLERPVDFTAYLPVFYANLKPAPRIPTRGRELLSDTNSRAILSLHGLQEIRYQIPAAAVPELWPEIWKWSCFLHTHREAIPDALPETRLYAELLFILDPLLRLKDAALLISRTVGLRRVVARHWALWADTERPDGGYLGGIVIFLGKIKMTDPPNIEEFIDGAGGTIQDVVKVFKRSLEFMPTALPLIRVFFSSLGDFDRDDSHIKDALVDGGLITSLLKVICASGVEYTMLLPIHEVAPTVLAALQLLQRMFKHSLTALTLREAVEAGIFRAVISCGIRGIGSQVIVELLGNVLPLCTMYHSILSSVARSLHDIRDLVSTPAFRTSEIFTMWANFCELAELHISSGRLPRSNLRASSRACGDMECGEIRSKTVFWRCGGCHTVYYCSPDCQRADWTRGGH
ncbi:hypothetical protein C8F04DRAFT_1188450 [Mycena alexandri]|uniref:MYND-type domain-containing protein n=1 Tax=Mycena alexandri TaxID=1745969 RepID=A0AAD6WVB1_9AGAR|nr:hypothetical protein C8F04DRAFT_1188450 [Mycena alexandri]